MDDYESDAYETETSDGGVELYDAVEQGDLYEGEAGTELYDARDTELYDVGESSQASASEAELYEDEEPLDFSPLHDAVPDISEAQETKYETDLLDVQQWVREINPAYDPYELDNSPYDQNCGSCAAAVWDRLEGAEDPVASDRTLSIAEMEQHTGLKQVEATPEEIEEHVRSLGPGGHVVVGVDRVENSGHWFNAYTPDGRHVYYVDGQIGVVSPWPPTNMGEVSRWDMSKR